MKDAERHLNEESNKWYAETCVPVIDDDTKVCLKYLEKYTTSTSLGNTYSFSGNTIHWCIAAATYIARKLTIDSDAPTEERALAMEVLVMATRGGIPETFTAEQLSSIISLSCKSDLDRLGILHLIEHLRVHTKLWRGAKSAVKAAMRRILDDLDIPFSGNLNNKNSISDAITLTKGELRRRISRPPS